MPGTAPAATPYRRKYAAVLAEGSGGEALAHLHIIIKITRSFLRQRHERYEVNSAAAWMTGRQRLKRQIDERQRVYGRFSHCEE